MENFIQRRDTPKRFIIGTIESKNLVKRIFDSIVL